jgi:DNA-binding NarL/FixJ family response regulator
LERMSRRAGFEGFVQKTNGARDLVRGVRAVLAGNKFYNSEVIQEERGASAAGASAG